MKEIVGVNMTIDAQARKVWDVIAAVGGLDKWTPLITACRVEGNGAGAKRFCTMADGTQLKEVIDEVDERAMRFRYRITEGLPVSGFEGTAQVKSLGNGKTEVTWYGAFEAQGGQAEGFRQMLRDVYPSLIKDLEKHCGA